MKVASVEDIVSLLIAHGADVNTQITHLSCMAVLIDTKKLYASY